MCCVLVHTACPHLPHQIQSFSSFCRISTGLFSLTLLWECTSSIFFCLFTIYPQPRALCPSLFCHPVITIFFSCSVLIWLYYQYHAGLVKWAWKFSFLLKNFFFPKSLRRIGISNSVLMFGRIQQGGYQVQTFLWWEVSITDQSVAPYCSVQILCFFMIQS